MVNIRRSAAVPCNKEQMYNLVNNIESYPSFISDCKNIRILHEDDKEVIATMYISNGLLSYDITTRNIMTPCSRIDIYLYQKHNIHQAILKHFKGTWKFKELDDSKCYVEFEIEFEFTSKLLGDIIGSFFHQLADTLVNIFKKRAEIMYNAVYN